MGESVVGSAVVGRLEGAEVGALVVGAGISMTPPKFTCN